MFKYIKNMYKIYHIRNCIKYKNQVYLVSYYRFLYFVRKYYSDFICDSFRFKLDFQYENQQRTILLQDFIKNETKSNLLISKNYIYLQEVDGKEHRFKVVKYFMNANNENIAFKKLKKDVNTKIIQLYSQGRLKF